MKIGLVLGGGVAKGAYQAGFLKAITEEKEINVSCVSSSSIGSLNGYAFAAGKVDVLLDLWKSVHFDSPIDAAYSVWFKRYLKVIVSELVCEGDRLDIPLYVTQCFFPIVHREYYKLQGDYCKKWYNLFRGAIYLPVLSGSFKFSRGQIAVDGGMMDNIPVLPLVTQEKPDVILVLHFTGGYRPREFLVESGIPIIDYDLSLHNKFRNRSFDFHKDTIKSMLSSGYDYGKEICENLFNGGENGLEEILAAADVKKEEESELRMTSAAFDSWVYRLNQVFYPFMRQDCKKVRVLANKKRKK